MSARGASIGATLLLLVLAGGAGQAQTQAPTPESATLRVGLYETGFADLETFYVADPAVFGPVRLMRCCLARTLLAYPGLPTLDGGTVLHPDLATEAPAVSRDGLLWSFRLRPDVHYQPPFEDRTVVAADIVRAIERTVRASPELADPGMPYERLQGAAAFARGEAAVISGLQSADPLSLTFRLTSPDGAFGDFLTDPGSAPIPEGAADGYDPIRPTPDPSADFRDALPEPETPYGRWLVSTGPFMYETYPADTTGKRVALVRNPSWDPATDPLRRPAPGRIEIVTVPTKEEAYAMLERGEIDVVDPLATADIAARYKRDPVLAERLLEGATELIAYIPMNLAVPPFDDVAVRRAVNAVVDRAALMAAHVEGRAGLPWMEGFHATSDVANHVFADHLTAGLLATYRPFPSAGGGGDVAAGRAEMSRSRYDTDGDGLCDAPACSGVVIAADLPAVGELLRDDLTSIGITATVSEVGEYADMSLPATRTAIQVNWWQWAYGLHGDLDDLLRGGQALEGDFAVVNQSLVGATPEQLAAWGYEVTSVPAVDDILDDCEQESGNRRAACWARLDQLISEVIVPWVPLYSQTAAWAFSGRVASSVLDQSAAFLYPALERTVVRPQPSPP